MKLFRTKKELSDHVESQLPRITALVRDQALLLVDGIGRAELKKGLYGEEAAGGILREALHDVAVDL